MKAICRKNNDTSNNRRNYCRINVVYLTVTSAVRWKIIILGWLWVRSDRFVQSYNLISFINQLIPEINNCINICSKRKINLHNFSASFVLFNYDYMAGAVHYKNIPSHFRMKDPEVVRTPNALISMIVLLHTSTLITTH